MDGYQLKLNGEAVRTVGFNLVPEDRTTGNTLPLWRIKEDVDLMKQLGANMARLSHLPLPKDFLDYLDEKGIMVFEEVPLWGKDVMVDPLHPSPKEWISRMVEVKFNHPSIIGWSLGNEIGYLNVNPKVMNYVKGAIQQAKQLDATRLAIYVSHSAHSQATDPVQYSDLIMYNIYGGWGTNVQKVNQLHPGKPIFMAEYGKELNQDDPDKARINAQEMMDAFRGKPYMLGASLWTFNDYRSFWKAQGAWNTPPSQNRTWGVVNTFRQKKQPYYAFRKEYAPVRGLKVEKQSSDWQITLTPREVLDIPAYPLRGYRLLWVTLDEQGKVVEGSFTELPEILPGTAPLNIPFKLPTQQGSSSEVRMEVHLLDPQDYSVLDTAIHFLPPKAPQIISVHTASTKARVVWEPVPNATHYQLRYRAESGEALVSAPTTNSFAEVTDLALFTPYTFQVVALNGAGSSQPSGSVKASTDEDELPPIIWAVQPADRSVYIGYSVEGEDYLYEIAYGLQPGQYSDTITLRNVGVCKIPHLDNQQTYYFRMRVRRQWGFASEWTHEFKATPDGGKAQKNAQILGIVSKDKKHIVLYTPVKKAVGYELTIADGYKLRISSAANSFFSFDGIHEPKLITIAPFLTNH